MTYFNEIKMQDIRYLLVLVPVACCWVWMTGEYFQMMLGEKKEKSGAGSGWGCMELV